MSQNRFSFLYFMIFGFIVVSFLTRLVLLGMNIEDVDMHLTTLLKTFGSGLFYDLVAASYYFIPLVIYLIVIPQKFFNTKIHKIILTLIAVSIVFAMLFGGVSEYFFWEEFGKRFNFIAVDYLVYTHEVIKNIQESYPLPAILSAIAAVSAGVIYLFRKHLLEIRDRSTLMQRLKRGVPFLLLPLIAFIVLDKQGLSNVSGNIYNNELAKNGTYSLFSAFRHNELDYDEFYKTLSISEVMANLKKLEHFDDKTPKYLPQTIRKNITISF